MDVYVKFITITTINALLLFLAWQTNVDIFEHVFLLVIMLVAYIFILFFSEFIFAAQCISNTAFIKWRVGTFENIEYDIQWIEGMMYVIFLIYICWNPLSLVDVGSQHPLTPSPITDLG